IVVLGMDLGTKRPDPCHRIDIRDNEISNAACGIVLAGLVTDVRIAGNRVYNSQPGIHFLDLLEGSKNIFVANNSVKNSYRCLFVEQPASGLKGIELRNNLFLAE